MSFSARRVVSNRSESVLKISATSYLLRQAMIARRAKMRAPQRIIIFHIRETRGPPRESESDPGNTPEKKSE